MHGDCIVGLLNNKPFMGREKERFLGRNFDYFAAVYRLTIKWMAGTAVVHFVVLKKKKKKKK